MTENEKRRQNRLENEDLTKARLQHRQIAVAVRREVRTRVADNREDSAGCASADDLRMMYGKALLASKRPPATRPSVTAGLKWPPEICPTAKIITMTVHPIDSATPKIPAAPAGAPNE